MPFKDMPAFVMKHKNVRNAIAFSVFSCTCLFFQLVLMDRNAINVVFDIIIPFSASVCFACYAITMAMDRPVILICPPTVYFTSVLINQLIHVEVGVKDTYPFVVLLEMIPFLVFSVCVATGKFKRFTNIFLKAAIAIIILAGVILAILAVRFRIFIFINRTHYLMNTFAMILSLFSVMFFYCGMIELVKISGIKKRKKIPKKNSVEVKV